MLVDPAAASGASASGSFRTRVGGEREKVLRQELAHAKAAAVRRERVLAAALALERGRVQELGERLKLRDLAAQPVPRTRAELAHRVRAEAQTLLARRGVEAGRFQQLLAAAQEHELWRELTDATGRAFQSLEALLVARVPHGLGLTPTLLDAVLAERRDPRTQARRVLREDVPGQLVLGQRSRRRASDPRTSGSKGPRPGSGRDYLLARLARDARPTLEALERGEYPSVVAAARAAGIHSPIVQLRPTPESYARSALATLDATGLGRLVHYLTHPQDVPSSQSRRAAAA